MAFLNIFRIMFNMMFLKWVEATGAVAGAVNAGINLYSTFQGVKNARKQLAIAKEQLAETKKMNAWEIDKYNKALTNQTEAIATLGNSFANFGNNNNTSTNTQANALGSDTSTLSAQNTQSAESSANANTSEAVEKEKEAPLPTERY